MSDWFPPFSEPEPEYEPGSGGRKRRGVAVAALVLGALVMAGGGAAAVTLTVGGEPSAAAGLDNSASSAATTSDGPPQTASGGASPEVTVPGQGGAASSSVAPPSGAANSGSPANSSASATQAASGSAENPAQVTPASAAAQSSGTLKLEGGLSVDESVGQAVDVTDTIVGGVAPYSSTVSGLPADGVTATIANTQISLSGTLTSAGVYPFTVTVRDNAGNVLTEHFTITALAPNSEEWSVEPLAPMPATVGVPYSNAFGVTGQTSGLTVTWALAGGALPPGLSLNSATGVISGTPTTAGSFIFSVNATDVATGAVKNAGTYGVDVTQ